LKFSDNIPKSLLNLTGKQKAFGIAAGIGIGYGISSIFSNDEKLSADLLEEKILAEQKFNKEFNRRNSRLKSIFSSDDKYKQQFQWFAKAVDKYGVKSGTGHKRILIPKAILDKEELKDLGFVGVKIAIPEAGQESMISYRNTRNLFHIHDFGNAWTMHEDDYEASTMKIEKERINKGKVSLLSKIEHTITGLPHVTTEGLPGLWYFTLGRIFRSEHMDERLRKELPSNYLNFIGNMASNLDPSMSFGFSGKDDAYNTVEGLRHDGGLAEKERKRLTDFGSGWVRNLFGNIFKTIKGLFSRSELIVPETGIFSAKEIKNIAKFSKKASVEEFAEKLGVSLTKLPEKVSSVFSGAVNVPPTEITTKVLGRSPLVEMGLQANKAYVDPEAIVKNIFGYSSTKAFRGKEEFLKTAIFHEATELRNIKELAHKAKMDPNKLRNILQTKEAHKATLVHEEFFLRKAGNKKIYKQFKIIRQASDVEYMGYVRGSKKEFRYEGLNEQTRKVVGEFENTTTATYNEIKAKRMKLFRETSYNSVGIGLRNAKNAGKGHCKFTSTQR